MDTTRIQKGVAIKFLLLSRWRCQCEYPRGCNFSQPPLVLFYFGPRRTGKPSVRPRGQLWCLYRCSECLRSVFCCCFWQCEKCWRNFRVIRAIILSNYIWTNSFLDFCSICCAHLRNLRILVKRFSNIFNCWLNFLLLTYYRILSKCFGLLVLVLNFGAKLLLSLLLIIYR